MKSIRCNIFVFEYLCKSVLPLIAVSVSLLCSHAALAEGPYAWCSVHTFHVAGSAANNEVYYTSPFPLESAQLPAAKLNFLGYLRDHYFRAQPYQVEITSADCVAATSVAAARAAIMRSKEDARTNWDVPEANTHLQIVPTVWVYIPMKQGTHSGGTKATEAEALYDAENWPGPFEDNQYKTIHSWDNHNCTTKQVTGVAGSSKPTTFYQCTVTFSYSDTASPVSKTAFGKGDTQDAAIAAAKSSTVGVTWGQPFCSAFTVTVKNKYKADYGHSSGAQQQAWACEIDYTATK